MTGAGTLLKNRHKTDWSYQATGYLPFALHIFHRQYSTRRYQPCHNAHMNGFCLQIAGMQQLYSRLPAVRHFYRVGNCLATANGCGIMSDRIKERPNLWKYTEDCPNPKDWTRPDTGNQYTHVRFDKCHTTEKQETRNTQNNKWMSYRQRHYVYKPDCFY